MAAELAATKKDRSTISISFGTAMDEYICSREHVLSPRTIMNYRSTRRNYIQALMDIPIDRITQESVQQAINREAMHLSPKAIRNVHGFISAVLRVYRSELALSTSLSKKI